MTFAINAVDAILSDTLSAPGKRKPSVTGHNIDTELPFDKMVKCVTVGVPLFLMSLYFAKEFATEDSLIACFPPQDFGSAHGKYLNVYCWTELKFSRIASGQANTTDGAKVITQPMSLFQHKIFPYILLCIGAMMYLPVVFWNVTAVPPLQAEMSVILTEFDNTFSRAVQLACEILGKRDPGDLRMTRTEFDSEMAKVKTEMPYAFLLFENYLLYKVRINQLIRLYLIRQILVLLGIACTIAYLSYFYFEDLPDEFSCNIRSGELLVMENIPKAVNCKLPGVAMFRIACVINIAFYILIALLIFVYIIIKYVGKKRDNVKIFRMLPFVCVETDALVPKSWFSDINLLSVFLVSNVTEVKSYYRLSEIRCLKHAMEDDQAKENEAKLEGVITGDNTSPGGILNKLLKEDEEVSPQEVTVGDLVNLIGEVSSTAAAVSLPQFGSILGPGQAGSSQAGSGQAGSGQAGSGQARKRTGQGQDSFKTGTSSEGEMQDSWPFF
ncbi:pannexin-3-like isoform X1 [Branchiostoma lanceolatum]|uniref:pannexin-3-like isoform X1 n=1 Tax=Branchiostoma lanceolatum TaxID=7740 RepID=UPI0034516EB0